MHYIQKHILDELKTVTSKRYAQLNRDEIESGHFRYHLTQLIKDGYVEQLERGVYVLTLRGQQYVDKLSTRGVHTTPMPKVITYTLLQDGDTVVLQEKMKQPYMHLLNMIGGKLHEGETSKAAAIREVMEKTGKEVRDPTLAGVFEVFIRNKDELLTHVIAYVYKVEVKAAEYSISTLQALSLKALENTPNLAPDCWPIVEAIQSTPTNEIGVIRATL